MPSASLSEESVLLRPHGWQAIKDLPHDCQLMGVDRHGKVVQINARLIPHDQSSQLAYVGTGAAVVALVGDTRLIANDGKKSRFKELIESTGDSRLQFETLVQIPRVVELKPCIDDLWAMLSDASAFRSSESVALRCRDSDAASRAEWLLVNKYRGQAFAIVSRHQLAKALNADWRETILDLLTCWLKDPEGDRIEVERSVYSLALWFAMALTASGKGYLFQFDRIQHSNYVIVVVAPAPPRPIQLVASAFYTPFITKVIRLTWDDGSIAPITGGFLLAAG